MDAEAALIAVVVIGYNEGARLRSCLASVGRAADVFRSATGSRPELLYVDSQSTDDSVAIADSFGIAVAQAPPGFNTCANNRMTGLALTESKYVMFVDGDMELAEHWLVDGVEFLERHHRAAGVAGIRDDRRLTGSGEWMLIRNYNRIVSDSEPVDRDVGGAFLLRRSALEGIGGLEAALAPEEDFVMFCQLSSSGWQMFRIKQPMIVHWDAKLSSISSAIRHTVWHPRATIPGVIVRRALTRETWAWAYIWHFKRRLLAHLLWLLSIGAAGAMALSQLRWELPFVAFFWITSVYGISIWREKRDLRRTVAAFFLRSIYLSHLMAGFVLNRPRIDFGVQRTAAYRSAIHALNPGLG